MLKKTITYTDYNDVERTEDFYFDLSEAELAEMELSTPGGFGVYLEKITKAMDQKELIKWFKKIILMAYGEKSSDGRRFIKSEELSTAFSQTKAYVIMYMEFISDPNAAADFINGVIPNKKNNTPVALANNN